MPLPLFSLLSPPLELYRISNHASARSLALIAAFKFVPSSPELLYANETKATRSNDFARVMYPSTTVSVGSMRKLKA